MVRRNFLIVLRIRLVSNLQRSGLIKVGLYQIINMLIENEIFYMKYHVLLYIRGQQLIGANNSSFVQSKILSIMSIMINETLNSVHRTAEEINSRAKAKVNFNPAPGLRAIFLGGEDNHRNFIRFIL